MDIEDLDLSLRAYTCLKRSGINTVQEFNERLERLGEDGTIKVTRNLGKKSLEEIKIKISSLDRI